MARFTFEVSGSHTASFQYHEKGANNPFYRKQPYFTYEEQIAGQLNIVGLDMNERVILGKSLSAGQAINVWQESYTKSGCIKLSDEELVDALEAIEANDPIRLQATARRSEEYAATRKRTVPEVLDVPGFSLTSIAGNLRDLRSKKNDSIKKIQADTQKTDTVSSQEPGRMLLIHAAVAGNLITGIEAELTDVAQIESGITEAVLRQKFTEALAR